MEVRGGKVDSKPKDPLPGAKVQNDELLITAVQHGLEGA